MAKLGDDYQGNDPRYPSQQQDRFIVRLPDGMRDRIKAAAEKNNRSMNAEIVATLEEKYPDLREGADVIEFMKNWLKPITEADNPEERAKAVAAANAAAESQRLDVKVRVQELMGGVETRLYFSIGSIEMMVNRWFNRPPFMAKKGRKKP